MSALILREASEAYLPAVAELWLQLDAYHRSLGLAFPESDSAAEKWLASFQRTLGRFSFLWVAEERSIAKAFLLARLKQSPPFLGSVQVGEISDLYVDESLRGSGIGARLLKLALEKFTVLKVHSVEVQVLARNDSALDFWLKQGFERDLTLVRMGLKGNS